MKTRIFRCMISNPNGGYNRTNHIYMRLFTVKRIIPYTRILSIASTLCFFLLSSACSSSKKLSLDTAKWENTSINSDVRYQAVDVFDAKNIWISGTKGSVASSSDGGKNWTEWKVAGAEKLEFRDISVISPLEVVLLSSGDGSNSRVYRTGNGGKTWSMSFQNRKEKAFFDCIDFLDSRRGIAWSDSIDGRFVIITTKDGGRTWAYLDPEIAPKALPGEGGFAASGTCLFKEDSNTSWMLTGASGVKSHLIKLTGLAENNEIFETPMYSSSPTAGSYSGYFSDDMIYIFGGDYSKPDTTMTNAYVTPDKGSTWRELGSIPFTGTVYGSAGVDEVSVVVGPKGSAISLNNGKEWKLLDSLDRWSVAQAGPESIWSVGPDGRVSKLVFGK